MNFWKDLDGLTQISYTNDGSKFLCVLTDTASSDTPGLDLRLITGDLDQVYSVLLSQNHMESMVLECEFDSVAQTMEKFKESWIRGDLFVSDSGKMLSVNTLSERPFKFHLSRLSSLAQQAKIISDLFFSFAKNHIELKQAPVIVDQSPPASTSVREVSWSAPPPPQMRNDSRKRKPVVSSKPIAGMSLINPRQKSVKRVGPVFANDD